VEDAAEGDATKEKEAAGLAEAVPLEAVSPHKTQWKMKTLLAMEESETPAMVVAEAVLVGAQAVWAVANSIVMTPAMALDAGARKKQNISLTLCEFSSPIFRCFHDCIRRRDFPLDSSNDSGVCMGRPHVALMESSKRSLLRTGILTSGS
jgi:hypothetical protein